MLYAMALGSRQSHTTPAFTACGYIRNGSGAASEPGSTGTPVTVDYTDTLGILHPNKIIINR
jgi:hypothetical protein